MEVSLEPVSLFFEQTIHIFKKVLKFIVKKQKFLQSPKGSEKHSFTYNDYGDVIKRI